MLFSALVLTIQTLARSWKNWIPWGLSLFAFMFLYLFSLRRFLIWGFTPPRPSSLLFITIWLTFLVSLWIPFTLWGHLSKSWLSTTPITQPPKILLIVSLSVDMALGGLIIEVTRFCTALLLITLALWLLASLLFFTILSTTVAWNPGNTHDILLSIRHQLSHFAGTWILMIAFSALADSLILITTWLTKSWAPYSTLLGFAAFFLSAVIQNGWTTFYYHASTQTLTQPSPSKLHPLSSSGHTSCP